MQILNDLLSMCESKNSQELDMELFKSYTSTFDTKIEDIQLIDSTKLLLTDKMEISKSQILFDIDCLLTPLMIYHNSINYIKNCEDSPKQKLSIYKNILDSLCIHDTIQTNIFEIQDWNELYDIASIYGSCIPNYYSTQLKNKKDFNIEFTSLLNKISQMYVNKKLLNSAKYSLGKLNYDNDEIIYITEIISNYFDNYKNDLEDEENNDLSKKKTKMNLSKRSGNKEINNNIDDYNDREKSSDTTDLENNNDNDLDNLSLFTSNKNKKSNNSDLIVFMNKYKISIDDLENILKIEKLNRINEKRKKKFTLKIKKEISSYLFN